MARYKSFDSTGVAPNGRLYAGDLNAIQDMKADLSNLTQNIDALSIAIGETGLRFTRYSPGIIQLAGSMISSGLVLPMGGVGLPNLTTAQRDALAAGLRPKGLVIWNVTLGYPEVNAGTDAAPTWTQVGGVAVGSVTNAHVAAGAAIARSKLDFGAGLVNADIAAAAAIAKSKLAALNIANADIVAGAAIDITKLAVGGSPTYIITNVGGVPTWAAPPAGGGGGAPTGAAGGGLTGSYPNPTIAANAIAAAQIQDGTVGTAELAADSVDATKIATNAVGSSEIQDGSVTNAKIAGSGIALAKIIVGAIRTVNGTTQTVVPGDTWLQLGTTEYARNMSVIGGGLEITLPYAGLYIVTAQSRMQPISISNAYGRRLTLKTNAGGAGWVDGDYDIRTDWSAGFENYNLLTTVINNPSDGNVRIGLQMNHNYSSNMSLYYVRLGAVLVS